MTETAMVIGAANGIGAAVAEELAEHFIVFPGDVRNCNINDFENVEKFFSKIGKVDLVVNTAGIHSSFSVEEAGLEEFDRVMETNMRGVFAVCKVAIPYLRSSKGMLINIASAIGIVPDRNAPLYSASKAWIIHFTKCLALKYAKEGIRFNCFWAIFSP